MKKQWVVFVQLHVRNAELIFVTIRHQMASISQQKVVIIMNRLEAYVDEAVNVVHVIITLHCQSVVTDKKV
jgi:hypothetical protein